MTFDDADLTGQTLREELLAHLGHQIAVVTYGDDRDNVAVECEDCHMVLVDVTPNQDEVDQ